MSFKEIAAVEVICKFARYSERSMHGARGDVWELDPNFGCRLRIMVMCCLTTSEKLSSESSSSFCCPLSSDIIVFGLVTTIGCNCGILGLE